MNSEERSQKSKNEKYKKIKGESRPSAPEKDVCQKAPEWAEHSRLHDEDNPCDDGRSGKLERPSGRG